MRHWVAGAGLFLLLGASVHETVAQDRLPIIDMHMHPGSFTLTVAAMEQYNIVLGFLSDSPDDVFEWVEALPGRFIASPRVRDPADVDLARLRRGIRGKPFRGDGRDCESI